MSRSTRGAALPLALVAVLVMQGLIAVAMVATITDVRLAADTRLGIEGEVIVASALADARVGRAAALQALVPGDVIAWGLTGGGSGWRTRADAERTGPLVLLRARAEFVAPNGTVRAARDATLVLGYNAADTLLVLRGRSRF